MISLIHKLSDYGDSLFYVVGEQVLYVLIPDRSALLIKDCATRTAINRSFFCKTSSRKLL